MVRFLKYLALLASSVAALILPTTPISARQAPSTPSGTALDPNTPEGALALFVLEGTEKFAPWLPGAADAYPQYFDQSLRATFNVTQYDYAGLQGFFTAVGPRLTSDYESDFTEVIEGVVASVNPANPLEGVVALQGRQGGTSKSSGQVQFFPNAIETFVKVVDGQQKLVEWYELSNLH